jgi:8-oxo-dGTP diphosphatase
VPLTRFPVQRATLLASPAVTVDPTARSPRSGAEGPPRLIVVAGLVWLGPGEVLLQRRSASASQGPGALEFPGGKVERGESPREALTRELVEEWGPHASDLEVGSVADVLHHVYSPPGPEVYLVVYHVDGRSWAFDAWRSRIELEAGARVEAHPVEALPLDAFLEADASFAEAIRSGRIQPHWQLG